MLKEWLKKRTRKSQSTSKTENSITGFLPPSKNQENKSTLSIPNTRRISTHTVTLDQFITCLCDEDYSILSGELSREELQMVWFEIYQDYVDAICSHSEKQKIRLHYSTQILEKKIHLYNSCHMYLYVQQELNEDIDPKIKEILRYIGAVNGDSINIKKIEGLIKMWQIELKQAEQKLDKLNKELYNAGTQGKTTRDSFQDFIVAIEIYVKYPISGAKTTMDRFLAMIKNYFRYCAAQEEQLAKMK